MVGVYISKENIVRIHQIKLGKKVNGYMKWDHSRLDMQINIAYQND